MDYSKDYNDKSVAFLDHDCTLSEFDGCGTCLILWHKENQRPTINGLYPEDLIGFTEQSRQNLFSANHRNQMKLLHGATEAELVMVTKDGKLEL